MIGTGKWRRTGASAGIDPPGTHTSDALSGPVQPPFMYPPEDLICCEECAEDWPVDDSRVCDVCRMRLCYECAETHSCVEPEAK